MPNESNDSGETKAAPEEPAARSAPVTSVNVWARIKEHKIAQWTLAYAAAAYALLDGTKIVSDAFDWPHQVLRIVTVLLILGLPVVVTLAWYHGHRALRRVSGTELTIITVLLLIAGGVLWHFARSPQEAAPPKVAATATSVHQVAAAPAVGISDKSIAVLPFVDMSEKHDQEYFSDGLSEELIDHLAHNPDLKVIARTSSFAFKGKNEDMRSIAVKLGVANLLEGSVRKSGGTLRITAQLIRATDGVHLWSEIYDRKVADIFKIQDEISKTVAKALQVALTATASAEQRPAANGTTNIAAYNLVLQGNYFYYRGQKGDYVRAIERFQQALNVDPRYAVAWARLARVYARQGYWGDLDPVTAETKGRAAADRALSIDPKSAGAYYARGNVLRQVVGDWMGAKSDYERAVTLDPNGEIGHRAEGTMLLLKGAMSGQVGDYIDWLHREIDRNPLDTDVLGDLAWYQQTAGDLDASVADFRKLLELNPAYATAQAMYAVALLLQGKESEALAAAEMESDDAFRFAALTCIYWSMDRRAESDSALVELEREFSDRDQYLIASVHAYRGEADDAFRWLDRAYQKNKGSLEDIRVDPLIRNLRSDPRFDALLRKVKLVE